jgi:SAM-dependent methyltransferase
VTARAVRDAYAAVAGLYIELFGSSAKVDAADLAFIERHLTIRPGRILDVGCGPGHLTAHLRSLGVDAAGIDLVPEFIAHARAAHPEGDYRLGSLRDLDAGDGSVDGILAWYSLIHLAPDDLDGALDEFGRVMAAGGTLVAGFVHGGRLGPFDHRVATAYHWPVDEFAARLARAGFTEVERQQRPADGTQRPLASIAVVRSRRRTASPAAPHPHERQPPGGTAPAMSDGRPAAPHPQ